MDDNKKEIKGLVKWLSNNPWWGIIGLACTILFGIISIYLYIAGIEKPLLTYLVHPVKTAMVNQNSTSRISVFYDNIPIIHDVSIAQIQIWNAGRFPIKTDDVLKRTELSIMNKPRILEAKILKRNREETGIVLDTLSMAQGIVYIDWRILERNDSVIIQLIYEGTIEQDVIAKSVIVHQGKIREINANSIHSLLLGNKASRSVWTIVFLVLLLVSLMFITVLISVVYVNPSPTVKLTTLGYIASYTSIPLSMICIVVLFSLLFSPVAPIQF